MIIYFLEDSPARYSSLNINITANCKEHLARARAVFNVVFAAGSPLEISLCSELPIKARGRRRGEKVMRSSF